MDFWDIMLEAEEASEYETLYMATLLGTSTNSKSPSPFISMYSSVDDAIAALDTEELLLNTKTKVQIFTNKDPVRGERYEVTSRDAFLGTIKVDATTVLVPHKILTLIGIANQTDEESAVGVRRFITYKSPIGQVGDLPIAEHPSADCMSLVHESIINSIVLEADDEEDDDKTTRDTLRDARKDLNDDINEEDPLPEEEGDVEDMEDEGADEGDTTTDTTDSEGDSGDDATDAGTDGTDTGTDTDDTEEDSGMDDNLDDSDSESMDSDDSSGDTSDDMDGSSDSESSDYTDDSSDGSDPNAERAKKINTIVLLKNFISFYKIIENTNKKLTEARKDNILTTVTINQVRKNLIRLGEVVYKYITLYYDGNDHALNLYNYKYFKEIFKLNVEMLRKMKNSEDNGQTNS